MPVDFLLTHVTTALLMRFENVRQLNIRWGKKLDFQLSHKQLRFVEGSRLRFLDTRCESFQDKECRLENKKLGL